MTIHPSHTTRYIYDLIKILDFDIDDYECLSKNDLFVVFWEYIEKLDDIDGSVDELEHLKKYLTNVNINKIKIADRDRYIDIAKNILFYIDNDCLLSFTNYNTEDELLKDVKMICSYCNLPTCYRAITKLNKTGKFKETFQPITTGKTKILLRKREQKRLKKINNLMIKTIDTNGGNRFVVTFD